MLKSIEFLSFFSFLLISQLAGGDAADERLQIRLSGGVVEGRVRAFDGHEVLVFQKIPFVEPPVGDLRFRPPVPKRNWAGVWDATRFGPPCAQRSGWTVQPLDGSSEDCMHMNVYADRSCLNESCPVIFYVHGGGFYFDAPTMFNETEIVEKLAGHRTVFVMPAYRLGIFGFLDLGSPQPDAPYNAGLLDLVTAVRWCQQELPNFGGDPLRMTAFGNSAGAALEMALLSSPFIEKRAFRGAIVSSGMINITPHLSRAMTLAVVDRVGCGYNGTTELSYTQAVACLRRKSTDELLDAMFDTELKEWRTLGPQPDADFINAQNVAEFLDTWRGLPIVVITTADEFRFDSLPTVEEKCQRTTKDFGYHNPKALDACVDYYTTKSNLNHTFRDAYHAFMHKFAALNTRLGFPTFAGIFAQPHGLTHAADLKYLVGLHPLAEKDQGDRLMDAFYPAVVRTFAHEGAAGMKDWLPTDEYGRNYLWMRFAADPNSTHLSDWPHMVVGEFFRPAPTEFWLNTLRRINDAAPDDTVEKEGRGGANNQHRPPIPPASGKSAEFSWSRAYAPPPPNPPVIQVNANSSASVWAAFWLVLVIALVCATALSAIIVFWLTFRLKISGFASSAHESSGQNGV